MKLSRTKEYQFGWLGVIPMLDVIFLLIFFLLLSSNFILQPGISVSVPLSRFTLGPQINPQIISITGGAGAGDLFSRSESCPRTTRTVARRGEKRRPADHYQGRSAHSLHARGRGDESGSRTRNYFRGAGHRSRQVSAPLASESDLGLVFAWEHPRRRKAAIIGISARVAGAARPLLLRLSNHLSAGGRALAAAGARHRDRTQHRGRARSVALARSRRSGARLHHAAASDEKSLTIPTIQHAPSYLTRQPALKEAPPLPPDPGVPSAQPPGPVEPLPALNPNRGRRPRRQSCAFHRNSRRSASRRRPEMKFTASRRESPQAAQFRVAVDENGEVRYCFLENSSGDAALDEQARKYLALCRFSAIQNPKSEIRE